MNEVKPRLNGPGRRRQPLRAVIRQETLLMNADAKLRTLINDRPY